MNKQFLMDSVVRFNSNIDKFLSGKDKIKAWVSELYCLLRFGCSPDDYFRYEFYKKSDYERNKFITYRRSKKIIRVCNARECAEVFQDKSKFNIEFADYINREWIDLRVTSKLDFERFLSKHHEVLIKPLDGGQGRGIFKIDEEKASQIDFSSIQNCICEEVLVQHKEMAKLHSTSINTVRVLTFRGEIIACALRVGGGDSVVDNLHSNGVCAHLDTKTGIIDALCIDNRLNKYLKHPESGMILVGFQVPNWNICLSRVREAAKRIPEVQYVGWDVAILENDVAIIEGNHDPGHDVVQMIAQTGLYESICSKNI